MMMAAFLAPERLGYYVVAVSWSGALAPILNSVAAVLFPRVAMETTFDGRIKALGRGTRLGSLLAGALSVFLFVVTPTAIRLLFGVAFEPAIVAALILVAAGGILSVNSILEEGLRGLGMTRAILWGESAGLVITVIGLIFLLPPLEIVGAAIASLAGYCVTGLTLLVQLQRISGRSIDFFIRPCLTDWKLMKQQLKTLQSGATQTI
jgi:O-antigen/teichoic acid export membrane protein